jgi:hypothetical protein
MAQTVGCLPSKHEVLCLKSSTAKQLKNQYKYMEFKQHALEWPKVNNEIKREVRKHLEITGNGSTTY